MPTVLKGEIKWPAELKQPTPAHELVAGLLTSNASQRLGGQHAAPVEAAREVKAHAWFASVEWKRLEAKETPPPFVPKVDDKFDVTNFDVYETDEGLEDFPDAPDVPMSTFAEWSDTWV